MKVAELTRKNTLSIPGVEVASLEYLRREDKEITLLNGAVLSFSTMKDGKEVYLLIGAEGDVNAILNGIATN